ncbi:MULTISPECIES: TraR/DksA family transcriptional regulator [Achromobacter]|jgi:DnaK suppressor protein|uniref:TraR/DksA family transcriptional regulator n=1 Tax=Achromobacter TaxID=222 RepID=UPI0009BD036D|nr:MULTISPECIES: TraR/DksA C4-type zinc finger protein [Achromobacter]MDH0519520.1 molecular chaperone DnaK [Achromobacter xylosoxidans]MDH0543658.1 molecular chaperone DnaK [Achromobacter xylosoxidans]MDQ6211517.1 molecular chaperone DnaK [Achromobacter insolitus]QKQ54419.1 molecular chaperone DnaK [Achromobacter xylosoxidans]QPR96427.1 molecular chaperone DnaK [Achromobacter xylosoxidans]
MTEFNRTVFWDRLDRELEALTAQLADAREAASVVQLDQSSVGRLTRMDAMQQQAMALDHQERLDIRRRRIVAALQRVENGTFGLCCRCGDDIAPDRLNADAATVFCQECREPG